MSFKRTKIVNTNNGMIVHADILNKSARHMKVVLDETDLTLRLNKQTEHDKNYTGTVSGLEFSSTGEEI